MAFPLIIDGYTETECANCPMLKDKIDSDSGDSYAKECLIFGWLPGGNRRRAYQYQRCEECIQMEQKHNKKPVTKDSGSPYDLSEDLNNIAKLVKTRQKLKGRKK